jgi:hypothetical protein
MIWGCISWDGVGYGAKIDGKMDSDLYCSILEDELLSFIKYFKKSIRIFSSNRIITLNTRVRR